MIEENDSIGAVGTADTADFSATYVGAKHLPAASAARSPAATAARAAGVASIRKSTTSTNVEAGSASAQDPRSLQAVVDEVNKHLQTVDRVLAFKVDAQTGLTIATISNAQTGEVLQQIPGTDTVHLAQMLAAWSPGKNLLLDLMA